MKQTIRYFTYALNELDDDSFDICEISENTFLSLTGSISYKRHTMNENGCEQICLTIEPIDYPYLSDVKL